MKYLILSCMTVLAVSASTFAAPISSVTCDSQMKFGFFCGNETGTFTYTASPLSVSVLVPGKGEVTIDDSTHICTVVAPVDELPLSVTADDASLVDLYFGSRGLPAVKMAAI